MTTASTPARDSAGARSTPVGLRRRMVRHYLPLAGATFGVLAVLVSVPFFDANRYPPPGDIFVEGARGAVPDSDYPPTAPPPGSSGAHDDSVGNQQGDATTTAPTTTAPAGHSGPPAGGHGPASTTTTMIASTAPAAGHSGPPAGGHSSPTTTPTGPAANGDTGAAAVMSADHAGDRNTVLRMRRLSTMTGYVAVALIALTLLIGPVSLMLRRRLPVSSYLRRDIGIWAAITSAAHVVFGLLVEHGNGEILSYFLEPGDRSRILTNSFGLANWAGLAAALIAIGLAAISSDAALRKLKAKRWKRLQRWNYLLAVLAAVHAVLYGALWRLTSPYTDLLIAAVAIVTVGQAVGVRLWRRRSRLAEAAT